MKLQITKPRRSKLPAIKLIKMNDSYLGVCGRNEILTLTPTRNGLVYAHAVEDKFWPIADEINRAIIAFGEFEAIVFTNNTTEVRR